MTQGADGFSYAIPCADVFEPNVEYFVLAFDAAGEKIGNAGSPENPVSIPVVSVRSQPAIRFRARCRRASARGGEEPVAAANVRDHGPRRISSATPAPATGSAARAWLMLRQLLRHG